VLLKTDLFGRLADQIVAARERVATG
jgi:hypothetical protein